MMARNTESVGEYSSKTPRARTRHCKRELRSELIEDRIATTNAETFVSEGMENMYFEGLLHSLEAQKPVEAVVSFSLVCQCIRKGLKGISMSHKKATSPSSCLRQGYKSNSKNHRLSRSSSESCVKFDPTMSYHQFS